MANTNALVGWVCPKCGNTESFRISILVFTTVTDNGIEYDGDAEWDNESYSECTECDFGGVAQEFCFA